MEDIASMEDAADAFLMHCEKGRRLDKKTLKAYRCDLGQLCSWLEEENRPFDREAANAWIERLNSRFAPSSVKRKVSSAKAFGGWLAESGFIDQSPFFGMRISIRLPKMLPRTIAVRDMNSIFREVYSKATPPPTLPDALGRRSKKRKGPTAIGKKRLACERAVFELLIATGIRVSELCSLDIDDVDMGGRMARIMGKGSKERMIQLENEHTLTALAEHLSYRLEESERSGGYRATDASRALFVNRLGNRISDQSVRDIVKNYAEEAGIQGRITPHMFRHTFATLLLESDIDIRYIQQLLGHSSIRTTEIYTHVASTKLRDILRESNPRNSIKL
ncbi:MAG: tyrosine-type recombinase/integrase [Raoultibacter sp.]